MFDDDDQQRRWEKFQQRRARYFGNDAAQQMPEIIYKRYEPPSPQQSSSTMDSETQAKWDAWCDARIEIQMRCWTDMRAEVLGSENAKDGKELAKTLRAEFQEELAKLRGMVEGNVTQLDRGRIKDGTNG